MNASRIEYVQGKQAYYDADMNCPYSKGSVGASLWWAGYNEAMNMHYEENRQK